MAFRNLTLAPVFGGRGRVPAGTSPASLWVRLEMFLAAC